MRVLMQQFHLTFKNIYFWHIFSINFLNESCMTSILYTFIPRYLSNTQCTCTVSKCHLPLLLFYIQHCTRFSLHWCICCGNVYVGLPSQSDFLSELIDPSIKHKLYRKLYHTAPLDKMSFLGNLYLYRKKNNVLSTCKCSRTQWSKYNWICCITWQLTLWSAQCDDERKAHCKLKGHKTPRFSCSLKQAQQQVESALFVDKPPDFHLHIVIQKALP